MGLKLSQPMRRVPNNPRDYENFVREVAVTVDQNELLDESVSTVKLSDSSVTSEKVGAQAITLEKMASLTADRVIGRLGSDGEPQALAASELASMIQDALEALNLTFAGDIGFHSVAATGQQSDAGAPSIATISGSGADGDINANFAALEASVNALRGVLNTKGLTG